MKDRTWGFALTFMVGCSAATRPIEMPNDMKEPPSCAKQGRAACEAACDGGDAKGCLAASISYGDASPDEMMKFELRGCQLGLGHACRFYANNFTHEPHLDWERALVHYKLGCDADDARSCGDLLTKGWARVDGGLRDPDAVAHVAKKMCDEHPDQCSMLADLHVLGVGVSRDFARARSLYQQSCDAGVEVGCDNLAFEDAGRLVVLHSWYFDVFHPLDPAGEIDAVPNGTEATVDVCSDSGNSVPVDVDVKKPSGVAGLDAVLENSAREWRIRAYSGTPDGVQLCFRISYKFTHG